MSGGEAVVAKFDDAKFEREDDLRTLERAVEIINDSKRYKAALGEAETKKKQLSKVTGLRSAMNLTK